MLRLLVVLDSGPGHRPYLLFLPFLKHMQPLQKRGERSQSTVLK